MNGIRSSFGPVASTGLFDDIALSDAELRIPQIPTLLCTTSLHYIVKFLYRQKGVAVAEWSKALHLREKTKSSQVCVPALKTLN